MHLDFQLMPLYIYGLLHHSSLPAYERLTNCFGLGLFYLVFLSSWGIIFHVLPQSG